MSGPTFRSYSWDALVARARAGNDPDAMVAASEAAPLLRREARPDYVFSNGRTFENKEYAPE